MLYLGDEHIEALGLPWEDLLLQIETAVAAMDEGDCAQPLKPYLRYRHPRNRIIAMPAYVGGTIGAAGLKWIASFPGNSEAGLPRAHSVTVLNDADTGRPVAIINSARISAIRTAAVSGVMLRHWMDRRSRDGAQPPLRVGIIGFGPIGRFHAAMCRSLLGKRLAALHVYDIRGLPDIKERQDVKGSQNNIRLQDSRAWQECRNLHDNGGLQNSQESKDSREWQDSRALQAEPSSVVAGSWEELYDTCDVIITCTVSDKRYINRPPRRGTLLLHVSLRDYSVEALESLQAIVVDDWSEVCRENTDIELLHRQRGLTSDAARTLADVVRRNALLSFPDDEPVLFCPMGMAIFDMAIAQWYVRRATAHGTGIQLA